MMCKVQNEKIRFEINSEGAVVGSSLARHSALEDLKSNQKSFFFYLPS
jgi:hypothetical protein